MPILRSLVQKSAKERADKVPAGFKTSHQWAASERVSLSQAQKLLRTLSLSKPPLVERRVFRVFSETDSQLRKVIHYRRA